MKLVSLYTQKSKFYICLLPTMESIRGQQSGSHSKGFVFLFLFFFSKGFNFVTIKPSKIVIVRTLNDLIHHAAKSDWAHALCAALRWTLCSPDCYTKLIDDCNKRVNAFNSACKVIHLKFSIFFLLRNLSAEKWMNYFTKNSFQNGLSARVLAYSISHHQWVVEKLFVVCVSAFFFRKKENAC